MKKKQEVPTFTNARAPTTTTAKFIVDTNFKDISASVIKHIKTCILDGFGVGLFGSKMIPWTRTVIEYVQELGGKEEASVWGNEFKVSAPNAVLANTMMVNGYELDDTYMRGGTHPGCIVLPTAVAVSEREGIISGKIFLTAVIVAYEVMIRVGASLCPPHSMQLHGHMYNPSVAGAIGSVAAAGKLLNLDVKTMESALHIAASQAAGIYSPTVVKRWCLSRASQGGIMAADLAKKGHKGIIHAFENPSFGFYQAFSTVRLKYIDLLTEDLGKRWRCLNVGFKPYSCMRSCHNTVDAVKLLLSRHPEIKPELIDKIRVEGTATVRGYADRWKLERVDTVLNAFMSYEYTAAVTALEGDAFIDQFTPEKVADPKIREFMKKVEVIENPEFEKPQLSRWHIILKIRLNDGRTFSVERDNPKGTPKNPMTYEEIIKKYTNLATKVVTEERADKLQKTVKNLDRLEDVSKLTELLS